MSAILGKFEETIHSDNKIAFQNVTSRLRLVLAYYISQSMGNERFLVVATGNRDEAITGYFTKYDCSSGDLSPIADLSKLRIRELIKTLITDRELAEHLVELQSSAELEVGQSDEAELGMTFEEMDAYFAQIATASDTDSTYKRRFVENRHKSHVLPLCCRCSKEFWPEFPPMY